MNADVVAYEIVSLADPANVHRIDLHGKTGRMAEKVFDGLCMRVDFERFFIRDVLADETVR